MGTMADPSLTSFSNTTAVQQRLTRGTTPGSIFPSNPGSANACAEQVPSTLSARNTESYGVQLSELLAFGGAGVSAGSQSRAPSSWLDELSQHLVASLPVAGKHIHGPSHLSSRAEWVWRLSATSATCQRIPSGILECAEVVLQEPATRMLPPWDAEIAGRAGVHLWAFVICAYAHIYIQSAHAFGVDVLGDEPTGDSKIADYEYSVLLGHNTITTRVADGKTASECPAMRSPHHVGAD
ncbi:hypothetical protein M431DRAFT_481511 [Trichoderma harzianum CBS 226.95]|uniref:Uncharacterized protein n=1 Tax=Trichoderma harzianum CBS 226.95 TaxID=983964 RepID=A0A2T4AG45_TRIHA|nr:hypothetical protein M431DRAFT_481511 [Trichoderma harzianum CBS 226.95]PTB56054.1 hypothetical protein M431DRAFT_481511 [Trichoderma harzianum CBS 226.95]